MLLNFKLDFVITQLKKEDVKGSTVVMAASVDDAQRVFETFVKKDKEWKKHKVSVKSVKLVVYETRENLDKN